MSAKKAAIGGLILWGVIAVIGIIAVLSEGIHGFSGLVKGVGGAIAAGYFIAGIPSGWRALTKITPNIFLFMPVIGWVIYFGAKLFLAIFVGVVAFPINLLQNFFHIAKAERLEQHLK